MMQQHLQAIVTVLSLVNPLICGAMFAQIEAGQTSATRLADATKAALAVLVILVIAALVGARVLHVFGVSLDAFLVAGGGCWPGSGSPCCAASRRQFPMRLGTRNGRSRR
jgi:multiple antibiotic resistance protein